MCETESLGIHLKRVHSYMCEVVVGERSVSVITTTSPDGSLTPILSVHKTKSLNKLMLLFTVASPDNPFRGSQ